MKRGIGFTWVLAVMSSPFSKKFPGMNDPDWCAHSLIGYLREGKFTRDQKKKWLPLLREYYEIDCRRRDIVAAIFPPKLQAEINRLKGIA